MHKESYRRYGTDNQNYIFVSRFFAHCSNNNLVLFSEMPNNDGTLSYFKLESDHRILSNTESINTITDQIYFRSLHIMSSNFWQSFPNAKFREAFAFYRPIENNPIKTLEKISEGSQLESLLNDNSDQIIIPNPDVISCLHPTFNLENPLYTFCPETEEPYFTKRVLESFDPFEMGVLRRDILNGLEIIVNSAKKLMRPPNTAVSLSYAPVDLSR
jgi:hypothetical protein